MYCQQCGVSLPAGSVFCLACGTRVEMSAQIAVLPSERFVKNPDGTVSDTKTGLTWAEGDGRDLDYSAAVEYCARGGWRMPTKEELLGLYAAGLRKGVPGTTKITVKTKWLWSSDPVKKSDLSPYIPGEDRGFWAFYINPDSGEVDEIYDDEDPGDWAFVIDFEDGSVSGSKRLRGTHGMFSTLPVRSGSLK